MNDDDDDDDDILTDFYLYYVYIITSLHMLIHRTGPQDVNYHALHPHPWVGCVMLDF